MMAERYQIYRCELCGNVVEVLHGGVGELVCCGESMVLMKAKKEEEGNEKHLPVVERTADGITVTVGAVPHPMEEKHYIEMVEILTEKGVMRAFLKPGDAPTAHFPASEIKAVREYCTVHGLWQNDL